MKISFSPLEKSIFKLIYYLFLIISNIIIIVWCVPNYFLTEEDKNNIFIIIVSSLWFGVILHFNIVGITNLVYDKSKNKENVQ